MKRGHIVCINLEDAGPPEMGKTRPGIIISNDEHNAVLQTVVVIPLSTRPPEIWPLRLQLPHVAGLKQSYAITAGMRQVSKARLVEVVGSMPKEFMKYLEGAYAAYLSE